MKSSRATLAVSIPVEGKARKLPAQARAVMATEIGLQVMKFAKRSSKYDRGWNNTNITYTVIVERP